MMVKGAMIILQLKDNRLSREQEPQRRLALVIFIPFGKR
jgi:hypothetical protein